MTAELIHRLHFAFSMLERTCVYGVSDGLMPAWSTSIQIPLRTTNHKASGSGRGYLLTLSAAILSRDKNHARVQIRPEPPAHIRL
jgi:hypothetical protein